jgi:hypothetical protein
MAGLFYDVINGRCPDGRCKKAAHDERPFLIWWPLADLNRRPIDYERSGRVFNCLPIQYMMLYKSICYVEFILSDHPCYSPLFSLCRILWES